MDKDCLQALRLTDPRDDKTRIEQIGGGLLQDLCGWILDNDDFRQWRENNDSQLLWVNGDPGKGKTMLLCCVIEELKKKDSSVGLFSYFFCQETDSRINTATAVLRGLIYLLIDQQPLLISHVRKRYDKAGRSLFEDANSWVALSKIFTDILQDPSVEQVCLILDALDECVIDRPSLLDLIARVLSSFSHVKWIVSSRNWLDIEDTLGKTSQKATLSLELNEKSVSAAVNKYIEHQVNELARLKDYDDRTKHAVQHHLSKNAKGTFLWVALVCKNLKEADRWDTIPSLNEFPSTLDLLYQRMVQRISRSKHASLFNRILALAIVVYRPNTLVELPSLIEMPKSVVDHPVRLKELVRSCGSFLTLRENTVYLVHQSAKDFLLSNASYEIFPSGIASVHYNIYSRSLETIDRTLHRDMYKLRVPGFSIKQVQQPDPDPLAKIRYSCLYWVEHLV